MLINFTKPKAGILNVTEPKTKEQIEREKKSPERAVHGSPKIVSFVPGMNDIPDKVWNKIKESETVQRYLKRGFLVLKNAEKIENKKNPNGPKKDLTNKEYGDLSSQEQIELMRETFQIKLLKKWKRNTKEGAMAFLNERIDRLENPQKYSGDQDME